MRSLPLRSNQVYDIRGTQHLRPVLLSQCRVHHGVHPTNISDGEVEVCIAEA